MPGETVWILPRTDGAPDAHGNVTPSWPAGPNDPGAIEVKGAKVAGRTDLAGEAAIADREAVIAHKRVMWETGPVPGALDRMWVRGGVYEVIGEATEWTFYEAGREAGVDVAIKRVEG